ncbi:MAG: MFS transporter [Candidatus Bathyarchaeota archaeon]|nr:MFS transporter [Candidatus Bathyarchaeota archaeon]
MEIDARHPIRTLSQMDTVTAALVVQFLVSVAFNLMGSFMPLFISSELNETLIEATGWTGTSSFIASTIMAVTAPFWGMMCDRIGTKKVLMIVLAGNIIVYAGMSFSADVLQIVFFRALQGGFGGISTVMFAIVASAVSPQGLKKALSYQMAAMTMGGLVAPGIGGLMASIIGYRITLLISAVLFILILPLVLKITLPPPEARESETRSFNFADFKSLLPDITALILVYICISFLAPAISWFLESLGIPDDQLLLWTTAATILNGLAYAVATPVMTNVVTDRTMPLLSVGAAAAIMATAFVFNPIQFIALRIIIGAMQAGIPPNLLGGKSGRKGTGMGFLNSARFLGMAIGPIMATTILGDGIAPRPFYMFAVMAGVSIVAALFIYLTHKKSAKKEA